MEGEPQTRTKTETEERNDKIRGDRENRKKGGAKEERLKEARLNQKSIKLFSFAFLNFCRLKGVCIYVAVIKQDCVFSHRFCACSCFINISFRVQNELASRPLQAQSFVSAVRLPGVVASQKAPGKALINHVGYKSAGPSTCTVTNRTRKQAYNLSRKRRLDQQHFSKIGIWRHSHGFAKLTCPWRKLP
jgi:hypothetical protein